MYPTDPTEGEGGGVARNVVRVRLERLHDVRARQKLACGKRGTRADAGGSAQTLASSVLVRWRDDDEMTHDDRLDRLNRAAV